MTEPVLMREEDGIALLTLNRPEKLNAISYATNDLLQDCFDRIEDTPHIRGVIITGTGKRAFSAGADIEEFSESIDSGVGVAVRDFVERGQSMTSRIEAFPKPVIAAVGGIAYGGGCEITEAAHLALASETATFAKPEIKLGIPPTFGGTQRLPRLAGRKKALELLLTGQVFSAWRAQDIGLINRVVAPGNLLAEAFTVVRQITQFSPETVAAILQAVRLGLDRPMATALLAEREAFAGVAGTEATRASIRDWIYTR